MDVRNELHHIHERGYRWYEDNLGKAILWHEYQSEATQYDDVYDEGGRVYLAAVPVTALWVIVGESARQPTKEGHRPTESISLAISVRAMERSAISDPLEFNRHLNDLLRFENRLWRIDSYMLRGDLGGGLTVVGVQGTQIFEDEEMVFDIPSEAMEGTNLQRPFPYPNETFQEFPEHDGPGPFTGAEFIG